MALDILDGNGVAKTVKTSLSGSDHVPHHHVDSSALPTGAATETTLGSVVTALGSLATQATAAAILSGLSALATAAKQDTLAAKFGALRTAGADAVANTLDRVATEASLFLFNGTSWDRARGDTTNGLDVDVTRLPALVAGTANIGDVDVLTLPALPAGTNNIGDVDVLTLPALPAGSNNIGDVDVLTLPALPAGTNNIGDVDVLTLPALPTGSNAIGKLAANTGVDIGDVDVTSIVPGTTASSLGKAEDAAHASGDTGVMLLAVRDDAVSADAADGDYVPIKVGSDNRLYVRATVDPTSTAANTNVSGATSSTQLLAATTRKGFTLWNDSAAIAYVKYATGASATSANFAMAAGGYYEDASGWQGVVYALWASATGSMRITEFT